MAPRLERCCIPWFAVRPPLELPPGLVGVAETHEALAAFVAGKAGLFAPLDPAIEGLKGPVYPPNGLLQGVAAQGDVLRHLRLEPGQFVLLVVVAQALSFGPGSAALFDAGVVQLAVQALPPFQGLKLSLVRVELIEHLAYGCPSVPIGNLPPSWVRSHQPFRFGEG